MMPSIFFIFNYDFCVTSVVPFCSFDTSCFLAPLFMSVTFVKFFVNFFIMVTLSFDIVLSYETIEAIWIYTSREKDIDVQKKRAVENRVPK
mmetsp:Transcript_18195/g.45958  ORF Transcript_18195/g.45958 Transcript_18195/m.45958 type:complete len:91 (-) Transcript_18195:1187-1459(-)